VASRIPRLTRQPRLAGVVAGLAACVAAASALAQETDGFGLRGAVAADAPLSGDASDPGVATGKSMAKPAKTDLPTLKPYPGASRFDQRGGPTGPSNAKIPGPTDAAPTPPPAKKRPPRDEKPFDPLGISLRGLTLRPYVEEHLGWASNPSLLPGAQSGSAFLQTQAGFALDSNWATSVVHGAVNGGWTDYFAKPSANYPSGNGLLNGRWDATSDLKLDAEARFALTQMTAGSLGLPPNVAFGPDGAPLSAAYGATVGATKTLGRFDLALHGSLDRTLYQDATYSDGEFQDLSANDFDDWGLRGRATYNSGAAVRPFAEVLVDMRRYADGLDQYGYQRDSDGVEARTGAEIDLAKALTGSLDVGYGVRAYQDARLPDLSSPLFDASLVWTATPLTTLTLKSTTALAETTIKGASGAAEFSSTLEVAHAVRRYLAVTAALTRTEDVYTGVSLRDSTTTVALGASYSLNRDAVLKAGLSREFYASSARGTNYCATVLSVGVRIQR
jgi:hypothetical protein